MKTSPNANFFRPYVAWALNDHVTRDGLGQQLRSFAACGYGGVMILPWGGTPYTFMSRLWLDRVAWAVELAAKMNLGVWLWDDWLFPSGFAGGLLGRADDHKSKKLKVLTDLTIEAGESVVVNVPPRFLTASVVEINKYNNPSGRGQTLQPASKNVIRYKALKRSRLVVVGWEVGSCIRHTVRSHSLYLKKDSKSNVYTCDDAEAWSCDMLNPATTREYLRLIHEKYWRRLKPHFGKTVHGFFYDEPHLPTRFPWTPGLTEVFQERKGYDLTPFLAPLLLKRTNMGYEHHDDPAELISEEKLKVVLADYHDVWTSLLAENFYGVIQEWCHEHGVLSIGHMGADETLRTLFSNGGLFFKNMNRVDMPGVDVIWGQIAQGRFDDFPRLAGSRAALAGKPFAVSESFAAQGHGTYPDEMRFLMEHQLIRGINHFIAKIANYSPRKSFFYHPPELNPSMNPMLRRYGKHLHQRIEIISSLLSQGRSAGKCAFYVPVGYHFGHDAKLITDHIADLARTLTYHQREFDYVWADDLVGMTVMDGSLVSVGGQIYGEILIPSGGDCEPEIGKVLKKLKRSGVRVIVCTVNHLTKPRNGPNPKRRGHLLCFEELASVACPVGDVIAQLAPSGCPLTFCPGGLPVSIRSRQLDDQSWVTFFLNESAESQSLKCVADAVLTERVFSTVGTQDLDIPVLRDGINGDFVLDFLPGESRLLFTGPRKDGLSPSTAGGKAGSELWLKDWKLKLPNGKSLRLQGDLPSWHELGLGTYSGFLSYTTRFQWSGPSSAVVLDLGEIRYAATVWLNQEKVGDVVFTPFRIPLGVLKLGWHTLRVEVHNTLANSICGTKEKEDQHQETGDFIGTYAPLYLPIDRQKIPSGMLGPVVLRA